MYDEDKGIWSFNEKIHTKIIEKYSIELFPNIYEADSKNHLAAFIVLHVNYLKQNALQFLLLKGLRIIHK
jgi:hypothetical protein